MRDLLAQSLQIGSGPSVTPITIKGPLGPGLVTLSDVISRVLLFLVPLASIILFFALVSGGFDILTSQGVPDKLKSGRAKITAGIIGFILIAFSYVIVQIIAYVTGLDGANSPI